MCLIIYKPTNEYSFSTVDMEASISRNDDGVGVMYYEDGRVLVDRLVEGTEGELTNFCLTYLNTKPNIVIHHRLKTHGKIDEVNTHPFKVLSIDDGDAIDLYMMHNGTLTYGHNVDHSDTHVFVNEFLNPILKVNPHLLYNAAFREFLGKSIGSNKLVFMDSYGEVILINEDLGKWQSDTDEGKGCWISNTYSLTKKVTYTPHVYHGGYYGRPKIDTTPKQEVTTTTTPLVPAKVYTEQDNTVPWTHVLDRDSDNELALDQEYLKEDLYAVPVMDWLDMDIPTIVDTICDPSTDYEDIAKYVRNAPPSDVAAVIEQLAELCVFGYNLELEEEEGGIDDEEEMIACAC
jgi:hypothetical protein